MTTHIQRLQAKHLRIVELLLDGTAKKDIAETLGLTPAGVINITNSAIFQHELARRRTERVGRLDEAENIRRLGAADILDQASSDAARTQVGLLTDENSKVRQVSAMDILDRTGFPRVTKSESRSVTAQIVLDGDAIDRIQKASREAFGEEMPMELEGVADGTSQIG